MPRQTAAVCDGEERDAMEIDFGESGPFTKNKARHHVASFVRGKAYGSTCQERRNTLSF
jgi:hypothetical protein